MSNQPIITHEDGATTIDCGDLGYAVIPYDQPGGHEYHALAGALLDAWLKETISGRT